MPLINDNILSPNEEAFSVNVQGEPLPWEKESETICYFEGCKNHKIGATSFCSQECKDGYWGKNTREGKKRWTIQEMQQRLKELAVEARSRRQKEFEESRGTDQLFERAQEIFGVK